MSVISEKSPKHCADKQEIKFNKKLFIYISTLSLTILSLFFLVWFILHPKNPHFSLEQAQINELNITPPFLLNSSIHLTLLSTNPNKKAAISYDQLHLYASYNAQIISPETSIPPFFQDHEESSFLSALLIGNQQPMDPLIAHQLQHDQLVTGKVSLDFKLTGRLRWKVGNWVSGRYRFNVICETVLPFGRNIAPKQGAVCSTSG
ncbi:hypothetical protein ACS0TY_010636 [Phlomoides rotata]